MLVELRVKSPVGPLRLIGDDDGVRGIFFPDHKPAPNFDSDVVVGGHRLLDRVAAELEAYFAGTLKKFTVPLRGRGTEFQQDVWNALVKIPYGETRTYAQVAEAVGDVDAVRAVAAAIGRNPVSILVPCHRVIGADGALTGYAGGVTIKRWLLDHEAKVAGTARQTTLL